MNDLQSEIADLKFSLEAKTEEVKAGGRERADLKLKASSQQEKLMVTEASLVDAQNRISTMQSRIHDMAKEYEDEGKKLREQIETCRDETAREINSR